MKKALGQTVRDIKREVNKKVLKVPSIEQKVLDATSNEPWGPHGSLLADIAQATRNYHGYQMIMSVIWKRINDTGKNWRHVYKALTVLDYLVANGSERVIEDIREHSYQISTLSDFQYLDSNGRDQGNNVRKKSQSLVVLVNDRDRIEEVRQKAAANSEKYRNTSTGNMYRPGSGSYDDRYESRDGRRDENRNDYGDSYGREVDRGSRYSEERYGREGYRDDDYRGRSKSTDDYRYGSRSRSAERERAYDDVQYSSRGNGAKADDHSQDGSTTSNGLARRYSEQNLSDPPSYEEAVRYNRSPTFSERDGESSLASAPKASSPTGCSPNHATVAAPPYIPTSPPALASAQATDVPSQKEVDGFDAFDPRGSFPALPIGAAPATSGDAGMDLLGSLSESFSSNSLALVSVNEPTMTPETNAPSNFSSGPTFTVSSSESINSNQPFDDPFGDGPFKAMPSGPSGAHPTTDPQFLQHEMSIPSQEIVILADILPPSSSFGITQISYPVPAGQSVSHAGLSPQTGHHAPENNLQSQPVQPSIHTNYSVQSAESVQQTGFLGQSNSLTYPVQASTLAGFPSQMGSSQAGVQAPFGGQSAQPNPNSNFYGAYNLQHNFISQSGPPTPVTSQMGPKAPQGQPSFSMAPVSSSIVPQPSKDKFETKSSVWADTLSRGLVNLNISGSKTNPLANIGVDFDALNRKDKRMEKPTTAAVTSTVTMGKAMGSGSGMDRAGAGAIMRAPQNPMLTSGNNFATAGSNMGGYGVSQPMGRGMGMNMPGNIGPMGQGVVNIQQQTRFPHGSNIMTGGYNNNPMMGSGNYGQQPYGGGYR